jgi:CheY-like chemotaxis protein
MLIVPKSGLPAVPAAALPKLQTAVVSFIWYHEILHSTIEIRAMATQSLITLPPPSADLAVPSAADLGCLANRPKRDGSAPRPRKTAPPRRSAIGNRVLLIGRIWELALYRAEVLSAHGYRVLTPRTPEQAVEQIRRGHFDVAILTYTLPSDLIQELAERIRQHCPSCPLIAISDAQRLDNKIFPDQTVLADEGPAGLVAALHRVTGKK